MSIISTGLSAIGKLVFVGVLLAVFLATMVGVVYMSLNGSEVQVPDITGKDFVESEKELAALGLRIRRRADRESTEKINTVIDQLPRAGDTVKSGQWISVVVSKAGLAPDQAPPPSLKKDVDQDDSEKIEEMISDKPKRAKANTNANAKKGADTTRDTIANTSSSSSNDAKTDAAEEKKDPAGEKKDDKSDKNDKTETPKPQATPIQGRPSSARPPVTQPNQRP
ncbi:MAG: PASTA domain-containing protein [bacterium]|nr:PASTA domain-containing protein [bacterium]